MAHAELREIVSEGGRIGQPETGVELDPVRGTARLRSHDRAPRGTSVDGAPAAFLLPSRQGAAWWHPHLPPRPAPPL